MTYYREDGEPVDLTMQQIFDEEDMLDDFEVEWPWKEQDYIDMQEEPY